MRYIGSKVATLPYLAAMLADVAPRARTVCDPFAGTCSVSRYLKQRGYRVSTGDVLATSIAIQNATIATNRYPSFRLLAKRFDFPEADLPAHARVIKYLNTLRGKEGFITENYSPAGQAGRLFFSASNAERIDAIRQRIESWSKRGLLSKREHAFLLAALVTSADVVANTAGTYYAHLKKLSRKASKPFELRSLAIFNNQQTNSCAQADALSVVSSADAEILYMDPPYNDRDYEKYYHLPETISLGDAPLVRGKSGVPLVRRTPLSDFCVASRATVAFEKLVQASKAKLIVFHYTPDGLIPHRSIMTSLRDVGTTSYKDLRVRKYSAQKGSDSLQALHRIYLCHAGA